MQFGAEDGTEGDVIPSVRGSMSKPSESMKLHVKPPSPSPFVSALCCRYHIQKYVCPGEVKNCAFPSNRKCENISTLEIHRVEMKLSFQPLSLENTTENNYNMHF